MRVRGREGPEWERGVGEKSGRALGMERDRRCQGCILGAISVM